jgi:ABC-type nitrate/sulfonate/bicarbonate transport system permease component
MGRLKKGTGYLWSAGAVVAFIVLWQLSSGTLVNKDFLPAPTDVLAAGVTMVQSGQLQESILVSLARIAAGWAIGSVIAIPIGLVAGAFVIGRAILDPFIHFFRFIPAIALISLVIIWFGVGEESKLALIGYATAFTVIVNTAVGAASIPLDKLNAARCLGAGRWKTFWGVILPASVPAMFTGMRIALAQAFLVIVAVEALAASSGLGYIIWNSRLYFRTDWALVGIVCLGVLGFLCDRLWKLLGRTVFRRYVGDEASY